MVYLLEVTSDKRPMSTPVGSEDGGTFAAVCGLIRAAARQNRIARRTRAHRVLGVALEMVLQAFA